MLEKDLVEVCRKLVPEVDFISFRYQSEDFEVVTVRQNVLQPVAMAKDSGLMVTVMNKGGLGYGATCDLSQEGIKRAIKEAERWAMASRGKTVIDFSTISLPIPTKEISYSSPVEIPWESSSLSDKIGRLMEISQGLKIHDDIVDWSCGLWRIKTNKMYLAFSHGNKKQVFPIWHRLDSVVPSIEVTANHGAESQTRSFSSICSRCRQGGLEILDEQNFWQAGIKIAEEAREILYAPNCPSGKMDLLLAPDQAFLQIHESIGHPLELDRILGDERNYAGTSFVTPEMFGKYQYGSKLLNITFDPTIPSEFASYTYDDDGSEAQKEFIIKDGLLVRPLGGFISQKRANLKGVANSRADSWRRPPIDRMANLNLEPGQSSLDDMIKAVEKGIYMKSNCSWSIDDSRNKFQFGCEWGQLIENGRLTKIVKKPNYRGISANFWRNLKMVGNMDTFDILGTPFCGKGEPNQSIQVGHACPACLFSDVDVFGGE